MSAQLPRAAATEHGLRPEAVLNFLEHLDVELHSLMIMRHGNVLAEGWWAPYGPDQVHLLYSLSKSFTATAAGLAVAEGLLDLDLPLLAYLDDLADAATGERIRSLTVRDTLRMATGHDEDTLWRSFVADPQEPLRGFLGIEPDHEPGSVFAYNNGGTYAVAAVIQRVTGQPLLDYLTPRLFRPLGIDRAYWTGYPDGRHLGYSGLHLTTESIARFGELYLRHGRWAGTQLIPADFVAEATSLLTPNPAEPNPDWQQGYGYQFWRSRYGYRADGAFGQFCLVLPDQDAVIAITSATEDLQAILGTVWQHLLPGFSLHALPSADREEEALRARLATLTLPTAISAETSETHQFSRSVGAELTPRPHVRVTGVAPAGGKSWRVSLAHTDPMLPPDAPVFEIVAAPDRWVESAVTLAGDRELRVAASGAWFDDIFRLDLVLVQTPHRMTLWYAAVAGDTITEWVTAPLPGMSLFGLALPRDLSLPRQ